MAKRTDTIGGAENARENPLIPHARLRQIYRSMLRARLLARALRAGRRGKSPVDGTLGMEACLVSAVADLGPDDLVSDALTGGVVEYLRGAALGGVLHTEKAANSRKNGTRGRTAARGEAECCVAGRLPCAPGGAKRIWAALGAAAALKMQAAKAKGTAAENTARQAGVAMVYVLPDELTAARWKKAMRFAAEQELPVIFVVLPALGGKRRSAKMREMSALAQGRGVPGIAVDADDAVAIYRVAQESIGHARIGGGAALMECVPFVLKGAAGRSKTSQDAIAALKRYMAQNGVASKAWMEREAKSFAKRIA